MPRSKLFVRPFQILLMAIVACSDDAGVMAPAPGSEDPATGGELDAGPSPSRDAASSMLDASLPPRVDASTVGDSATPGSHSDASPSTPPTSTGGRPAATSLSFPTTKETHATEAPYFNITRPVDLSAPGGLLPVVVWANGGCLRSDFTWSPLFERWAGAGYVVLSLTGNSTDEGVGGLLSMLDSTSKTEHRALIDWVVKANASGPYAGKLDLARVVLAGNSCGGVTALESAAEDDRAAAVFVLSGSSAVGSVNEQVMKAITIPVGYVIGGDEDIAGANARMDYAVMNPGVPAMIVNRTQGDHVTVSTDEMILPQDAEISLQWLDLALYGNAQAYAALTSPNVCSKCPAGDWTLTAKNLESLVK